MTLLTDTTPAAAAMQLRVLRRLEPANRLLLALDISSTARALLRGRLRSEHPDWPEVTIQREILRCTLRPTELPPQYR